jgi:hypothetical protein
MAPNPSTRGYLNEDYLTEEYLGDEAYYSWGVQANLVIDGSDPLGIQFQGIIDSNKPIGVEADLQVGIDDFTGVQSNLVIDSAFFAGLQTNLIVGSNKPVGVQFQSNPTQPQYFGVQFFSAISDLPAYRAVEARMTKSFPHWQCEEAGYLAEEYLVGPYLVPGFCVFGPMQFKGVINDEPVPFGVQAARVIEALDATAVQALRTIADAPFPVGVQADRLRATTFGVQARFVLYNTTNLRILCDFPSRGAAGAGNNSWGNPKGTGQNWLASSTEVGDFGAENLNTDIVEQRWQSAAGVTSAILSCDTETAQGTAIDTIALLGHNLTTSAVVTVEGSTSPTFAPVGETISMTMTVDDAYYIAPVFPVAQYRYWRLLISDPTNPDGFLYIGTIVFGTTIILQGECFTDEVTRGLRHFSDKVQTEGFTNVSNDRSLKRTVSLDFRMLRYSAGNYRNLRSIFETARTSLKCLWIPDPQDPTRFGLFSKLTTLPSERHKKMGPGEADTVSFGIDLDESL